MTTQYVRWFKEVGANDTNLVGGKGANLGEMARAGLPVPPGFCLTAAAYRLFIREAGVQTAIHDILALTRLDDPAHVEAQSARIRDLIAQQAVPPAIVLQVTESYLKLAQEMDTAADAPVAIRSSATAEDLPTASFAGQQDTYLNVCGIGQLLAHIRRCWASLWTARAITYRVRQGFAHDQVALAVVVQAMIPSEVSGVMFTANPVSGRRSEALINASWGLGEAIVSGLVTPDTIVVHKASGQIISQQVGSKERIIAYAPAGGTVEQETPAAQQRVPALSAEQVRELVALGQRIEAHYGKPQDIEWAYAHRRFYLLQARPITTLAQAPSADGTGVANEGAADGAEYNRRMFVEIFPDPLSPVFLSVVQPLFKSMLDFTFRSWGFRPPQGIPAIGVFYHQPYFNRAYIAAALQPLSPATRDRMVAQIVNPFGRHERHNQGELSLPYLGMMARVLRFMVTFPKQLPGVLARYRAEVAAVAALPLDTLSDAEIVGHMQRLVLDSASRLLNYDFLMIALIGLTYQLLGTLLHRYAGDASEELRAKLISGVTGNVTVETNKRLWDLAQVAKASPAVRDLLRQYDAQAVRGPLEQIPDGRRFLNELDLFLAECGHREVRMDILYPTWGEDPAPVFAFVRAYLEVDSGQSPHEQQARLVEQREALARRVQRMVERDRVGRWVVSPLFRWVLRHTLAHARERDTMHFELTRLFPPFRRLLLALGQRWQGRTIQEPEDIFFLTLDEMAERAAAPRPMQETVQARRAAFEASKQRAWPEIIRSGEELYGESTPHAVASAAGQLHGVAGSPGTVTGVARVIRGPGEFGKLQPGEILVAPLTNPVWTPLFAIAGGVVTEVGGILSHGAIVAREYGIPAVMAVAGVTQRVQEGQTLTVDGNRGTVSLA